MQSKWRVFYDFFTCKDREKKSKSIDQLKLQLDKMESKEVMYAELGLGFARSKSLKNLQTISSNNSKVKSETLSPFKSPAKTPGGKFKLAGVLAKNMGLNSSKNSAIATPTSTGKKQ